ncbi:hypothetical protein MNBD_BACTEROID01-1895 [hydrothermal vent metagenome]|uniref:Uncharacterized protein n=1 Tax=hydrothermal vent metagenome TaxID=652676 RepID=A0A3B0U8W3_9ZZZZ
MYEHIENVLLFCSRFPMKLLKVERHFREWHIDIQPLKPNGINMLLAGFQFNFKQPHWQAQAKTGITVIK